MGYKSITDFSMVQYYTVAFVCSTLNIDESTIQMDSIDDSDNIYQMSPSSSTPQRKAGPGGFMCQEDMFRERRKP